MTQDNEEFDPEELADEVPEYEDLVTELPEREVDLAKYGATATVSEAEQETEMQSDIKYLARLLTPQYKDQILNDELQAVMVARIFPDNMLDSCKMTTLARFMEFDPDNNDFDPWRVILAVHNAHSIGYEGRGIIDRLELAGVAHEEEMEKLSKELGL